MKSGTRKPKVPVSFRIRPDVEALIGKMARQQNISRTRIVELCVLRQSKDVCRRPFEEVPA